MSKSRSFKVKISDSSKFRGRYTGISPYQAANKALSEIIRQKVKSGENIKGNINFMLMESTKNSKNKIHHYSGKRNKLKKAIEYTTKSGNVVKKEYKNILKKIKKCNLNNFKLNK